MVQQSTRGHRPGRSRGSSPLLIDRVDEWMDEEYEVLEIDLKDSKIVRLFIFLVEHLDDS